jgi:ribonuclease G
MGNEIIINVRPYETRVALLENRNLSELFIERPKERGLTGNIYRGRVTKILPGMQVAFVDIGLERSGFLHQSDINLSEYGVMPDFEKAAPDQNGAEEMIFDSYAADLDVSGEPPPIEDILVKKQEIMVQVVKEPIGNKGVRISSYITLPGRYLVFMPLVDQVGVSRRIHDPAERERLKSIVSELHQPGKGYIIRTAAETVSREDLIKDIDFLDKVWERILGKNERANAPALINRDLDIILRAIRDLTPREVDRIVIDSAEGYERCVEFIKSFIGGPKPAIELYGNAEPIFDAFGLEMEIERALGRKVWLKSGGYITLDQTEALAAIDVNTGKFVGKRSQEETILKTNLEAVKEIVYQIKLRNIGGLIIIDFIDMEKEQSKEQVYKALEQMLRTDRSRSNILNVSEFGLVEMTRKRTRESLSQILSQPCVYCEGKGLLKSPQTICYEIFREIERSTHRYPLARKLLLEVSPRIAATLYEDEELFLEKLEAEKNYNIKIKTVSDFPDEQFEVSVLDREP